MPSVNVPRSQCPYCGIMLNSAGSEDGSNPRPGDLTVCMYCCEVARFCDDLTLAKISLDSLSEDLLNVILDLKVKLTHLKSKKVN